MDNTKIDLSGTKLVEYQKKQRENAMIDLILRQTAYDRETAANKLKAWDYNYLNVIKEYMNPNFQSKPTIEKQAPLNQMIYSEIRNFMDNVNKQQLWRKRQKEAYKRQHILYLTKLAQSQHEANNVRKDS